MQKQRKLLKLTNFIRRPIKNTLQKHRLDSYYRAIRKPLIVCAIIIIPGSLAVGAGLLLMKKLRNKDKK